MLNKPGIIVSMMTESKAKIENGRDEKGTGRAK